MLDISVPAAALEWATVRTTSVGAEGACRAAGTTFDGWALVQAVFELPGGSVVAALSGCVSVDVGDGLRRRGVLVLNRAGRVGLVVGDHLVVQPAGRVYALATTTDGDWVSAFIPPSLVETMRVATWARRRRGRPTGGPQQPPEVPVGQYNRAGWAGGAVVWVASAPVGLAGLRGAASGGVVWAALAAGVGVYRGQSTGVVWWSGTAGAAGGRVGGAAGAVAWVGGVTPGVSERFGDAAGTVRWGVAVGVGGRSSAGVVVGAVRWGVALGVGGRTPAGVVVGAVGWAASGVGARAPRGTVAGAVAFTGAGAGFTPGGAQPSPTGAPGSWSLAFQDEFNGTSLDTAKWNTNEGKTQNGVTNHTANVAVAGGEVVLTLVSSSSGAMLTTGTVDGWGSDHYLLPVGGFTEAMVYFPGSGSSVYNWPAWWAVGDNWPANGENDIAEGLGGGMTVNYHSTTQNFGFTIPGSWVNAFHVFGLHRKAGTCDVYYDGVLVKSYATADPGAGHALVLNLGNGFGTAVYGAGSQVRAAYVRAWIPGVSAGAGQAAGSIGWVGSGSGSAPQSGGGGGVVAAVGAATLAELASSATITVPVPSGCVPGEVLLVAVTSQRSAVGQTWGVPSGWTQVPGCGNISDTSSTGMITGLYYRVVTGSEAGSYQWVNTPTGRISGAMQRFSGVDTATILDAAAGITASDVQTNDLIAPTVTAVTAGALLVSVASVQAGASTDLTTPAGMTLINSAGANGGRRQAWGWEQRPAVGATGTRTWTKTVTGAGSQWTATNIVLRPAAGGGGAPGTYAGSASGAVGWVGSAAGSNPGGGGGGGTVATEGAPTLGENAASTTIAVPVPTGRVAGEVLVAAIAGTTTGALDALTAPAGWTAIATTRDTATSGVLIGLYYRVATGSEAASYTWTNTSATAGRISGAMQRFSGVNTAAVLDVPASTAYMGSVTGTTVAAPSITTVTDGAALVSMGSVMTSGGALTEAPSMTLINTTTGTGRRLSWAWETDTAAGATGTRTWTTTADALQRAAILAALRPASGGGGHGAATLTHRVVGPTGMVATRTSGATSVKLKVGTNPAVTTGVTYTAAVTPDAVGNSHHQTSLPAGGTYYYRVVMSDAGGDTTDTGSVGRLLTAPAGATSFAFCFGSDHHVSSDSASMAAIAARQDSLFIICGDLYNPDNGDRSVAAYRNQMNGRVELPNYQSVLATTPSVYTAGDHCYGMQNDSTGTTVPSAVAPHNQVFREVWPVTPYQGTTGEYFTFAWGRVRFIILDAHTWKSAYTATDNSSKTMLGTVQKQWVKDTITASPEPLIFVAQHYAFSSAPVTNDGSWSGYTTERTELVNYMNGSGKKFVVMHGDMHAVAWCDGASYSGGILDIDGSCLNGNVSQKGSPWNQIYPSSGSAASQQYGRVVLTDTGSQITLVFTGYSSDNTARVTRTQVYAV